MDKIWIIPLSFGTHPALTMNVPYVMSKRRAMQSTCAHMTSWWGAWKRDESTKWIPAPSGNMGSIHRWGDRRFHNPCLRELPFDTLIRTTTLPAVTKAQCDEIHAKFDKGWSFGDAFATTGSGGQNIPVQAGDL